MRSSSCIRCGIVAAAAASLGAGHAVGGAPTVEGTLATSSGPSVPASMLAEMINAAVPPESCRYLVFSQCFGGDMLQTFNSAPNTAAAAADGPGEASLYGGYHNDAARGLRPGAGRTAADAHAQGVRGSSFFEAPITGGTKPLADFSLEPITATSQVQSRHIVVYAGQPEASFFGSDFQDVLDIQNNFAGEPNTSITTVGGNGPADGFNLPGTEAGLREAFRLVENEFDEAADPSREQFILFVTDHGGLSAVACPPTQVAPPGSGAFAFLPVPAVEAEVLLEDPTNTPYIEFTLPIGPDPEIAFLDGALPVIEVQQFLQPGAFDVFLINDAVQIPLFLFEFEIISGDLNLNDGGLDIIGDEPGESIRLRFPIPEQEFIDILLGGEGPIIADLFNFANPTPLVVSGFELTTDAIVRPDTGAGLAFAGCNAADVNEDGVLSFGDATAFVAAFNDGDTLFVTIDGDASGDTTGDGVLSFGDVTAFVDNFNSGAGCP